MIVTDTHVVVGPKKCGATYVRLVLSAAFPSSYMGTQHIPLCDIPDVADRQIVGLARNPWAWYHSKWAYFYNNAPATNRYGFSEYMRRHFGSYTGVLSYEPIHRFAPPLENIGPASFAWITYHERDPSWIREGKIQIDTCCQDVTWMHTETLTSDLVSVFGESIKQHLDKWKNSTNHGAYQDDYTQEWINKVECADWPLIRKFGYEF
jgi:hypothetical protein